MRVSRGTKRIVCLVSLAIVAPANASQLWGVYSGSGAAINLNNINTSTGAVSAGINIPASGVASVDDMASDPLRDPAVIWAVRESATVNQLVGINPLTQTITATVPTGAVASVIRSLAIDPTTGFLYGATTTNLYRIDKTSGATTLIGPTSLPVNRALGFDALENLFGISGNNNFVAVDKSTGGTSSITTLALTRMEDLAVDPDSGTVYGLGFDGTIPSEYNLYAIDPSSGALTKIGPSLSRPAGMAFTNVPEPATSLLALFAMPTVFAAHGRIRVMLPRRERV